MRKISELWTVGWSFFFFIVTNRGVVFCYSKVKGVALCDALLGYNNNYLRSKNDVDLSPVEGLFRPSTENWFQPEVLGEYVSSLLKAAAFHYKKMPFSFGV